jgi:hypothetical protein
MFKTFNIVACLLIIVLLVHYLVSPSSKMYHLMILILRKKPFKVFQRQRSTKVKGLCYRFLIKKDSVIIPFKNQILKNNLLRERSINLL